jgi:hypothetical protein
MNQAQVQAALVQHDRIQLTMDIPLFFGNKNNETITPQQLVEWLEMAATVAACLDNAQKCTELFLCI